MADKHRPRRGSMAFSPRKRANRQHGRVKSWPSTDLDEVRVQGFAGWKAGMTHVLMRDLNPYSPSAGVEVRHAVTVVEVPPIRVLAVRGYHMTPYGLQTAGEAWADAEDLDENIKGLFPRFANRSKADSQMQDGIKPAKRGGRQTMPKNHDSETNFKALKDSVLEEVRLLVATQPSLVSGSPSKTPEIMELGLTGSDIEARLEWGKENLGKEIIFDDVYSVGQDVDVIGITKGKGFQGSVKRWGVKLLSHKNSKKRRQAGNLGDFGTGYVRSTVPQAGQVGFHHRTEYNKRILRIDDSDNNNITPAGGFLRYGEVKNQYVIIKGSLPGPTKRLLRFRDATRSKGDVEAEKIEITHVSNSSKQGV